MVEVITIILVVVFLIGLFVAYIIGFKSGSFRTNKLWGDALPGYRKEAILKSRAVLGGQFSEQLAPYLPDFPYLPTECRFIGKPVDFLVFRGMDNKKIDEIIFVEVKSGKSGLSQQEKNLRETIENKRVKWIEYRIPEELTKKGDVEERVGEFFED